MRHHRDRGPHPDYAKIAQLERELGLVEDPEPAPIPAPAGGLVTRESVGASRPAPRPVAAPDNVCAQCIPGRPPAHGCPFWPQCQGV